MATYNGINENSPTYLDENIADNIIINQRSQYNRYLNFNALDSLEISGLNTEDLAVVGASGSVYVVEIPVAFQQKLAKYQSVADARAALTEQGLLTSNTYSNVEDMPKDIAFYFLTANGMTSSASKAFLLSTSLSAANVADKLSANASSSAFKYNDAEVYFLGCKNNNKPIVKGNTNADALTGRTKVADSLTFAHSPSFGASSADRITNFNPKEKDKLQIQLSQFGADAAGTFKVAKNAKALTKALASTTDFVYLQPSGELYYNENGAAAGFGIGGVFAVIGGNPVIKAANIGFI